jgi:ribosomal-protein-alanine N-acetyltransferase
MTLQNRYFKETLQPQEAKNLTENQASRRVVEKLGFREEGIRRRQLHIDGAWRDHICYALTVEDVPGGLLVQWRRARESAAHGGSPVEEV